MDSQCLGDPVNGLIQPVGPNESLDFLHCRLSETRSETVQGGLGKSRESAVFPTAQRSEQDTITLSRSAEQPHPENMSNKLERPSLAHRRLRKLEDISLHSVRELDCHFFRLFLAEHFIEQR